MRLFNLYFSLELWSFLFVRNTLHPCCTYPTQSHLEAVQYNHSGQPQWRSWKLHKHSHSLYTHTLLAGHSRRWSWPLQSRTRGGKHTPFLAMDQQHGGWLRPLERRRQENQRVGLLMWIPCNLTSYRGVKMLFEVQQTHLQVSKLNAERTWIMSALALNSWIFCLLQVSNFSP